MATNFEHLSQFYSSSNVKLIQHALRSGGLDRVSFDDIQPLMDFEWEAAQVQNGSVIARADRQFPPISELNKRVIQRALQIGLKNKETDRRYLFNLGRVTTADVPPPMYDRNWKAQLEGSAMFLPK